MCIIFYQINIFEQIGCGKKRSQQPPSSSSAFNTELDPIDDSIGSLLDLNSEPAVEDLMRQIMSEAKLWEAIQEANLELNSQKLDKEKHNNHLNLAFNAQ